MINANREMKARNNGRWLFEFMFSVRIYLIYRIARKEVSEKNQQSNSLLFYLRQLICHSPRLFAVEIALLLVKSHSLKKESVFWEKKNKKKNKKSLPEFLLAGFCK